MTAVNKGHLHVAEILVENRADVNYRNKVKALIPVTQVPCSLDQIPRLLFISPPEFCMAFINLRVASDYSRRRLLNTS